MLIWINTEHQDSNYCKLKGNIFSSFANTIESNQKQIFFFLQKHSIYHFALQNKLSRIGKQYFRLRNINNTILTFSFEFHFPSRPDFNLTLLPTEKEVAMVEIKLQQPHAVGTSATIDICHSLKYFKLGWNLHQDDAFLV